MAKLKIDQRFDVSVIIPTYNATSSLIRAVNSVLNQPRVHAEVIVIEDGSPSPAFGLLEADFPTILVDCSDGKTLEAPGQIRYLHHANEGAYYARLRAVKFASGEFLKFLDQDDFLLPETLSREVCIGREHGIDAVLTNWQIRSYDARDKEVIMMREAMKAPVYKDPISDFLTVGGCYTSAVLYRTQRMVQSVHAVRNFKPTKADDWLIFAQFCVSEASYRTIDMESYVWTKHSGQLSEQSKHLLCCEQFKILSWIESALNARGLLSEHRRRLLASYYAKHLLISYESDRNTYRKILVKLKRLHPRFRVDGGNILYRGLVRFLGIELGVPSYCRIRNAIHRLVTMIGIKRRAV